MMSERDTAAVETPDFLLAALERADEAVVIVDSNLQFGIHVGGLSSIVSHREASNEERAPLDCSADSHFHLSSAIRQIAS